MDHGIFSLASMVITHLDVDDYYYFLFFLIIIFY